MSEDTGYALEFSYAGGALYDSTDPDLIYPGFAAIAATPGWQVILVNTTTSGDGLVGTFPDTTFAIPTTLPLVDDTKWLTAFATFSLADFSLSAGAYDLMFVSTNELNKFYDSFTYLDNVSLTAVPESSGSLLLGAAGVLGLLRRRRKESVVGSGEKQA